MTLEVPKRSEIRRERMNVGLTQSQLAEEAGVSQAMVARIEGQDVDPCLSTVQDIAETLDNHAE